MDIDTGKQNMRIWDAVCETDPDYTKKVSLGPYKFTAIDAQYQIKRATEFWGPYGTTWGLRELDWTVVDHKDGSALVLKAEFYYPSEELEKIENPQHMGGKGGPEFINRVIKRVGSFEIASDMPYHPKKDCYKKLQTDLTTKALSKLGFNSDVFEGKFDDNRYVQEMRDRKQGGPAEVPRIDPAQGPAKPSPQEVKNDPFLLAIAEMRLNKNWSDEAFWEVMGAEGHERLEEVTNEVQRRKLAAALRLKMNIRK